MVNVTLRKNQIAWNYQWRCTKCSFRLAFYKTFNYDALGCGSGSSVLSTSELSAYRCSIKIFEIAVGRAFRIGCGVAEPSVKKHKTRAVKSLITGGKIPKTSSKSACEYCFIFEAERFLSMDTKYLQGRQRTEKSFPWSPEYPNSLQIKARPP